MKDEAPTERVETDAFGKTLYKTDAADRAVVGAVEKIATDRRVSMAQVALAWLLRMPGVTRPSSTLRSLDHLDEAVVSLDMLLSPEEVELLE